MQIIWIFHEKSATSLSKIQIFEKKCSRYEKFLDQNNVRFSEQTKIKNLLTVQNHNKSLHQYQKMSSPKQKNKNKFDCAK